MPNHELRRCNCGMRFVAEEVGVVKVVMNK